ncbi:MAG TPA: hypothetical protein VF779_06815 [Pyrinomonadaceae bacterium]
MLALSQVSAFAQKPDAAPQPQTEEQRKAQQELEHKALVLLDDIIKEGDTFKQPENRIQIKATSAYILWKYDETRARNLFREVTLSMADLLNNPPDGEAPDNARMFGGAKMLQGEIAQMMGTRDPRMAREFLRATRVRSSQPGKEDNPTEGTDAQIDLTLAAQVAQSDPKLTVEIADEYLSKGLPYQLLNVITELRAKDPDAAAKLADKMMTKLRAEKFSENEGAGQIAVGLLGIAIEKQESKEQEKENATATKTPLLDQAAMRDLTEMIAGEALRGSGNYQILYSIRTMMPTIEKYAPARAAQIKQKLSKTTQDEEAGEGEDAEEPEVEGVEEYRTLLEKGSADELLAAASKSQSPMREMYYQSAAVKLAADGDAEHARAIINEKVKDAEQRKNMLVEIDKAVAMAEAEKGKVEQSRKLLGELHTNEERVQLLTQLAIGANTKGEKKIALKFLEEASTMISQRAKSSKQLGSQLAVAHAYAQIEPSRSFAILEPVVDQLNELLGAAVLLYGFSSEEFVRDDEIMLKPLVTILSFAGGGFVQYNGDFALLARADFERTKNLMDKFQRDEVRIMMRLNLVQGILAPLPETTSFMMQNRRYAVD